MSQRDSGYERKDLDLYETPEWVTQALLPHIKDRIDGPIWEPAAGSGKMVRPLEALGWPVLGTDIATGDDFLTKSKGDFDFDFIITNPPYEKAQHFIQHAIGLTMQGGLVAMLLRTDFDHAKTRQNLFSMSPRFAIAIANVEIGDGSRHAAWPGLDRDIHHWVAARVTLDRIEAAARSQPARFNGEQALAEWEAKHGGVHDRRSCVMRKS